jgi:hypothetical protein
MASMEAKHPGIREWATMPEVNLPFSDEPAPPAGSPFDTGIPSPLQRIWQAAQTVFNTVSLRKAVDDVAQHFTRVQVVATRGGGLKLTVTIQAQGLQVLNRVAPEATYEFAESVAAIVHAELFDVIAD